MLAGADTPKIKVCHYVASACYTPLDSHYERFHSHLTEGVKMHDELNRYLKIRLLEASARVAELGRDLEAAEARGEWLDGDDSLRDDLGTAIGKFEAYGDVLRFMNAGAIANDDPKPARDHETEFVILSGEKYEVTAHDADEALEKFYAGEAEHIETDTVILDGGNE